MSKGTSPRKSSQVFLSTEMDACVSSSVAEAVKELGADHPVSGAVFARAIFKLHPEYAAGKAGTLRLEETPSTHMTKDWLDQVRTLFDLEHTEVFIKSSAAPVIQRLCPWGQD